MIKRLLLVTCLILAMLEPVIARGTRRSPTQLDNTSWKVMLIDGQTVRATPPSIHFYDNGRVQIRTLCSVFLAGDFGVLLWRIWTRMLDAPQPRLPCGDIAIEEEARTADILRHVRSFSLRDNGRLIVLKDRQGRLIEARTHP